TNKFMLKGNCVCVRISAASRSMASGWLRVEPREPSAPALLTATTSAGVEALGIGAWMIGRRMPSRSQSGVCNILLSPSWHRAGQLAQCLGGFRPRGLRMLQFGQQRAGRDSIEAAKGYRQPQQRVVRWAEIGTHMQH